MIRVVTPKYNNCNTGDGNANERATRGAQHSWASRRCAGSNQPKAAIVLSVRIIKNGGNGRKPLGKPKGLLYLFRSSVILWISLIILSRARKPGQEPHALNCGARASEALAGVPDTGQQVQWSGVSMVCAGFVDRFFPSTKPCSRCGQVKKRMPLKYRTYCCLKCGLTIDRDLNAAINLEREARRILIEVLHVPVPDTGSGRT